MQCSFDAGAIVLRKRADAMRHIIEIFARDRGFAEIDGAARKTAFGLPAQIHHHFDQILQIRLPVQRIPDVGGMTRKSSSRSSVISLLGNSLLLVKVESANLNS